jgi:hypothetical protein
MKPVSKEAVDLVKRVLPNFAKSADHTESDSFILMLDAFEDDPLLSYAAIWYATQVGKSITFTPEVVTPSGRQFLELPKAIGSSLRRLCDRVV